MTNLQTLTCPSCGGKLEKDAAPGTAFACDYCGATITMPEGEKTGGIEINVVGESLEIDGDLIGGQVRTLNVVDSSWVAAQLPRVEAAIDVREDNLSTDKARLKEAARKIWLNALKKKDGDWDEVTHELNYLVRDAKDIFEVAAGLLTDSRSEVRDFIEPLIIVARKSADARPLFETAQSFGAAMAGDQAVGNANIFTAPTSTAPPQRQWPVWAMVLVVGGIGCCVLPIIVTACLFLSSLLFSFGP